MLSFYGLVMLLTLTLMVVEDILTEDMDTLMVVEDIPMVDRKRRINPKNLNLSKNVIF